MANLSNINNKFLVTTGGNVGINVTSPTTGRFVVNTTSGVAAAFGRDGTDGDVVQIYNGVAGTTKVVALGASGNDGTIYSQYGNLLLQPAAGNVGIGTVSPSAGLQVAKGGTTIPVAGSSTASAVFGNSTSDDNYGVAIGANSSGVGYISSQRTDGTATTYNLAIQPNGGNVGIGTTSPDYNLEIENASSPTIATKDTTNNVITKMFSANSQGFIGTESNHDLRVRTNNTDKITIQSGGNVGIGTISPSAKLQVLGTAEDNQIVGAGVTSVTEITNSYVAAFGRLSELIFSTSTGGGTKRLSAISSAYTGWNAAGLSGDLRFSTRTVGDSALSEKMRIDSSGNVGIGTAAPAEKLQVAGNIRMFSAGYPLIDMGITTSNYFRLIHDNPNDVFKIGKNGAGTLNITGGGNVGIGTAGPEGKLNIETNAESNVPALGANTTFLKISNTGGAYGAMIGQLGSGNSYIQSQRFDGTATAYNLAIQPNGGNVGIGTTGPTAKLHIAKTTTWGEMSNPIINIQNNGTGGNINTTHNMGSITWLSGTVSTAEIKAVRNTPASGDNVELRFSTSSAGVQGERMTINNVGNVGIGVTDPDAQLEIVNSLGGSTRLGYLGGSDSYFDSENFYVRSGNGNTNKFIINSSGKVGIGTTSPAATLELYNISETSDGDGSSTQTLSGQDSLLLQAAGGGVGKTTGSITWRAGSRRRAMITSVQENSDGDYQGISFYTKGTDGAGDMFESMRITHSGGISFGTTGTAYGTSGQVLTSNGNASPSWQAAGGSSPWTTTGNDIYNNNTGSVGIGVSSPVAKLDVNGDCSYEDVNTGTTTVTTATKTLEFTVFLDGGSASLGVTYQLLSMEQPQYNTSVAVATMEYGASLDSGTGRVGGSVMAITKWAGNWYQEDNIELGFAGTTSGKPSLFWEYGDLKVTAQRYCNMVCRIRLTYRGFGSSTTSPVTKNYPT